MFPFPLLWELCFWNVKSSEKILSFGPRHEGTICVIQPEINMTSKFQSTSTTTITITTTTIITTWTPIWTWTPTTTADVEDAARPEKSWPISFEFSRPKRKRERLARSDQPLPIFFCPKSRARFPTITKPFNFAETIFSGKMFLNIV